MSNKGAIYGALAYLMWGVFPVYFKALKAVPALEILFHRIFWSFLFLLAVILIRREWPQFRKNIAQPKILAIYTLAALLLAANWFVYVWGVNSGHVVDASLGYFINPLLSVALGVVLLGERLRPVQWLPVGLATAGVLYMTLEYGKLPWIALTLAVTFGCYGLLKKIAPLNALQGIGLETAILFLPALAYLTYLESQGQASFGHLNLTTSLLLSLAGVITVLPLLLFATAARSIPLSLLGLLQYIAPTGQFLLGVLAYGETFDRVHLVGFLLVWTALLIFTLEGFITRRRLLAKTAA